MSQLRQQEKSLQQSGVQVAVVTFDADFMALAYVKETQLPWPLLVDKDRELYRRYQMTRGGWWSIYGPLSIWRYIRLVLRHRRWHDPGSDYRQLGGDVLIDPEGIVRLHFVSSSPHDRPTPEAILDVVNAATPPRS